MNQPVNAATPPFPNYLPWAITIIVLGACCCCAVGAGPGIVAIVYGNQVAHKFAAGDVDGARRASENAKLWCWIGTALIVVGMIAQIVLEFTEVSLPIPDSVVRYLHEAAAR